MPDEPRSATGAWIARAAGLAAAGLVAGISGAAAVRVARALRTAQRTVTASAAPAEQRTRLLIVGDGAAAGSGADPASSLAGRIARHFPMAAIDNRARPGAMLRDVVRQLDVASRYDVVLVVAGGSDVIGLTARDRLRRAMRDVVWRARLRAPVVIVVPPADLGAAPFFLRPLSALLSRRARLVQRFARQAAGEFGAFLVPLVRAGGQDRFRREPRRFFARDGLHYSADGYALMLVEILRAVPLGRFLRGGTSVTDRRLAQQLAEWR